MATGRGCLRVLHVIASLSPRQGGTTSALLQMIDGLRVHRGDQVRCEIATSDDSGPGLRLAEHATERCLPERHYFAKRTDIYGYTPDMAPWLVAHLRSYDLVHIHGLFSHVNGLAGRACRRLGVPYIVTPHGMAGRYAMSRKAVRKRVSFALVERRLLEGAAAVHLTSRAEEREFAHLGLKTPVLRIPLTVLPMPEGRAEAFRAKHPELAAGQSAVFMGRLHPIKNLESAIDALALPAATGWRLIVGGDGPDAYVARLLARAMARGVEGRICWAGFVNGDERADVLAAGDVYLQASLSESFGVAAVEAVSAGLPCVLSENAALANDLAEAGFAVSVSPFDAEAMAAALARAAKLKAADPRYAQRARRFVETSFSPARTSDALVAAYSSVCLSGQRESQL